jgi:hypothetical protein
MQAVENIARGAGRTLITLDTGYVQAGIVPRYSIDPEGRKQEANTILYNDLP